MKLLEYKGKELLKQCGIKVPPGIVVDNKSYVNLSYHKERYREFFQEQKKVVIKAQVIAGKRKLHGLIADADNYEASLKLIDEMYKKTCNNQRIMTLLIERKLEVAEEYFLSIRHDTKTRMPIILFSRQGGIDIETAAKPVMAQVSPIEGLDTYKARMIAKDAGFDKDAMLQLGMFLKRAYDCFERFDCRMLEINPIIRTTDGLLWAGDAKIEVDTNALARQELFSDVTEVEDTSFLTSRELEARKIDLHDYRGVAGKTFVELDGDIAVLASGGGASLICMDALLEAGGRPANYTEYSGNPPREKVKRLTEITLSRPGLKGCLVIGGTANFTDILETLSGFVDGVRSVQPKPGYPIVIRRAGPNDKLAFTMLRDVAAREGYDITVCDETVPLTQAVKLLVQKVNDSKVKHGHPR